MCLSFTWYHSVICYLRDTSLCPKLYLVIDVTYMHLSQVICCGTENMLPDTVLSVTYFVYLV